MAALALGGHVYWWYWPRVHAAVPDPEAPFTSWLRNESFAYSVWIPYPHQNLAALRRLGGLGGGELRAMGRLAGLPEPKFPSSAALAAALERAGRPLRPRRPDLRGGRRRLPRLRLVLLAGRQGRRQSLGWPAARWWSKAAG